MFKNDQIKAMHAESIDHACLNLEEEKVPDRNLDGISMSESGKDEENLNELRRYGESKKEIQVNQSSFEGP